MAKKSFIVQKGIHSVEGELAILIFDSWFSSNLNLSKESWEKIGKAMGWTK